MTKLEAEGMTMMKKLGLAAFLATIGSVTLLAHGPSGHHGHSGQHHHPSGAAAYGKPGDPKKMARVVVVTMKETDGKMLFEPARIEVKKNEQVRFRLENVGDLEHEFLLGTPEEIEEHAKMMKAMPDMKHDDPNSKQVGPKATGEILWHFTNAGEFDFACLIPGHREAGMSGKIIVK
jgi:uncharacterized cupredoxin-like copper-binding protein